MSKWSMGKVGDKLVLSREPIDLDPLGRYSATGVKSFGKGLIHYNSAEPASLSKMRYFRLPPESLVVSNIKAREGAVAVTGRHVDDDAVISNGFLCYRPKNGDIDIDFVKWFLLSERGSAELGSASPGSADRNRTLSIDGFESLELPSVDIGEQRRISSWLSAVETRCRMARDAHRRSGIVSSVLAERVVQIASSSEHVRLGQLMEVARTPIVIDERATYKPIGVRSFGRGLIRYPSVPAAELSKLRYSLFPVPSLIVSNIKAGEGAIALAEPGDEQRVASNRFIPLVPRKGCSVDLGFVKAYLLSASGLLQVGGASPGSADRNRTTSLEGLLDILIPDPGVKRQTEVGDVVRMLDSMCGSRTDSATRLDALLPAALNQVFGSLN